MCNNAAALTGPLSNSSGTLAAGVAKPFDYPVQHGCNGAGYTAAIIIDDAVNTSYVAKYLSAAGVTQTGTITNTAVDGGGTADDPETDLDVQTISGLAPGANIIVYDIGSLSDQAIEDGYNKALSDGKAAAVNSSFGGCESSDPSFESSTNSIAEQGASEGVEFSASSGDSGSNECGSNDNAKGVSAPAGGPYFTSIGGVNFTYTTAGVLQTVTAGNTSCGSTSGSCEGGGGVSTVVAEPSFQSGIAGMITSGRNQPDISLPFDPVAVYTGGAFASYLGTSWSSRLHPWRCSSKQTNSTAPNSAGSIPRCTASSHRRATTATTRLARPATTSPTRVTRVSTIKPPASERRRARRFR